jgi:hypothetical protein
MSSSLPDGFDVRFATEQDASAVAELARASEPGLYERAGMYVESESVTFEKELG